LFGFFFTHPQIFTPSKSFFFLLFQLLQTTGHYFFREGQMRGGG